MEVQQTRTELPRLWFDGVRFGMFIHWGLYSIPAVGEWTMMLQGIPHEQYRKLAGRFTAKKFDARAWVALAKQAGAEYVVFTTRHHDGFSLFDSQVSDFTSVKTAARRDFVAEFTAACREAGLRVGLYYSLADWRYPTHSRGQLIPETMDYLRGYVREQVRELLTHYGRIDLLWFDGPFGYDERGITWEIEWPTWDGENLLAMARELQPGITINDRARVPGDYETPEQHIKPAEPGKLWEACMTLNDNWGYHKHDNHWKPAWLLVANLVQCAAGGGAYLLNIGPKADGTVPVPSVKAMQAIGRWLGDHGEAIFGTERPANLPKGYVSFRDFTQKGNCRYMFLPCWPGTTDRIRCFPYQVKSARLLRSGHELTVRQDGDVVNLTGLPARPDDPLMSVVRFEVGEPI